MDTPPILHVRAAHKGAFVMERDGKRLAEMTYTTAGAQRVIIDHTNVDDALRGTGAGRKLVEAAVLWARAENKRILPLCPFAKSVFDKTPAYADVLAQ
jgi:predicted GNAT family acetyltransferase